MDISPPTPWRDGTSGFTGMVRFLVEQWPRSDAEIIPATRDGKLAERTRRQDMALPEILSNALMPGLDPHLFLHAGLNAT